MAVSASRVFSTNSTSTSVSGSMTQSAEPSGDGFVPLGDRDHLKFVFFGDGSADQNFHARISAWQEGNGLWFRQHLIEVVVTLGTATGIAGTDILDTELVADTIALAAGDTPLPTYNIVSPAANRMASLDIMVPVAAGYVEVEMDIDAGGAAVTSANALVAGWRSP